MTGKFPLNPNVVVRTQWYISPRDITDRSANLIGRGGFGEVFTGTYFGSKVAIKQLLGNYSNRELAEYHHEIDIWQKLSHPNILPLLGACDKDDDGNPIPPFMVSPFMPNGTLRNHVANNNVPLEEKLRLLYQVASGMAYLHGRRIIHGDLKALNILLDGLNNAVVTDFGMPRTKHTSASLDRNRSMGPTGGTEGYLAPEMLDGDDPSGSTMKTDVYAFAITMYEVLNDAKPVWVTSNGQVMRNRVIEHISCEGKRPKRLDDIPDAIWALVERCWAQDPAARPAFTEILAVLQPYNRAVIPASAALAAPAAAKFPSVNRVASHFTTLSVNNQPPSQSSRPAELKFDGIESATRLPTSIVSRAKQGDPDACLDAAKMVSEGLPARHQDWKLAAQLYKVAADRGKLEASFQLAWLTFLGEGMAKNDRGAFVLWQEVSNKSDDAVLKPIATHMLGWMHYLGRGTQQDKQKGIKTIRDNKSNVFGLGEDECLASRWNDIQSDCPASCKFFELCQLGSDRDWICKHLMAMCMIHGFGTRQDRMMAARTLEELAQDGHSDSQLWIGECYKCGEGVSKDYEQAFQWFNKSAEQGNPYGQWWVGYCYHWGFGVAQFRGLATDWFRKSADQGNRYGQAWLGECFKTGHGIAKNNESAVFWLRRSADQGLEFAISRLNNIDKRT